MSCAIKDLEVLVKMIPSSHTPKPKKIEQILNQIYKDKLRNRIKLIKLKMSVIGPILDTNLNSPTSLNLTGRILALGTSFGSSVWVSLQ